MPVSLHPTEKAKSYLTLIGVGLSLVASLYAGAKSLWGDLSSVVTKEKLIEHNSDRYSHQNLRDELDHCAKMSELATKRVEEMRSDQIVIFARLARIVAADRERDNRKKDQKATATELAFKRYIRQGLSLEEAYLTALEETSR